MPLALLLVWLGDSADVLLKSIQPQAGTGSKKRILRYAESGIHNPRQPPRERIEYGDQVGHLSARHHGIAHAQTRNIQDACLRHNPRAVHPITTDDDRICVKRLRQFESARPRRLKLLRQAEVIQRIHTIRTAHGRKPSRGKTRVQNLRRCLANPLEVRLTGSIIERKDQQDPILARIRRVCPGPPGSAH